MALHLLVVSSIFGCKPPWGQRHEEPKGLPPSALCLRARGRHSWPWAVKAKATLSQLTILSQLWLPGYRAVHVPSVLTGGGRTSSHLQSTYEVHVFDLCYLQLAQQPSDAGVIIPTYKEETEARGGYSFAQGHMAVNSRTRTVYRSRQGGEREIVSVNTLLTLMCGGFPHSDHFPALWTLAGWSSVHF